MKPFRSTGMPFPLTEIIDLLIFSVACVWQERDKTVSWTSIMQNN